MSVKREKMKKNMNKNITLLRERTQDYPEPRRDSLKKKREQKKGGRGRWEPTIYRVRGGEMLPNDHASS